MDQLSLFPDEFTGEDYKRRKKGKKINFTREELRDAGMQQALDHANEVCEVWGETAYRYVVNYSRDHDVFTSEQVRTESENSGEVPLPSDKRSWGSVMTRVVRSGYIVKIGIEIATDPKVHYSYITTWKSIKRP
jgi:hypothetical protein